jgi:hypothetical protein
MARARRFEDAQGPLRVAELVQRDAEHEGVPRHLGRQGGGALQLGESLLAPPLPHQGEAQRRVHIGALRHHRSGPAQPRLGGRVVAGHALEVGTVHVGRNEPGSQLQGGLVLAARLRHLAETRVEQAEIEVRLGPLRARGLDGAVRGEGVGQGGALGGEPRLRRRVGKQAARLGAHGEQGIAQQRGGGGHARRRRQRLRRLEGAEA